MKRYTYSVIFILLLLMVMGSSCDDDFEEINTNPNALTEIDPEYLFANGTFQTLKGSCNLRSQFPFGPIRLVS